MKIIKLSHSQFEWDSNKNKNNRKKHHIDFEDARDVFNSPIIIKEDNRKDYGEIREIGIGKLNKNIIVVIIFTIRNNKVRLISARMANKKERKKYHDLTEQIQNFIDGYRKHINTKK